MNQAHGRLVEEFDTRLPNVLLQRFFTLPVLAALAFFAGFSYLWITDSDSENAMVWRLLLFLGAALLVALYGLLFRKMYKAEIYEHGILLTDKRSRKVKDLSFDQITHVRDVEWTHRYGIVPFFKRRELEIHIKSERRVISIDGKSMMTIKSFSAALSDAYDTYRKATDAQSHTPV